MRIILQCIFAPDTNQYKRWLSSFRSIPKNETIIISGWVDPRFRKTVRDVVSSFPSVTLDLKETNTGKSRIINTIAQTVEFDHMIYMDSDIIITCIFDELEDLLVRSGFQVLAPNQRDDKRHSVLIYENQISVCKHRILYPNTVGIAGGMFIANRDTLLDFPHRDVGEYGPDDTFFFLDLISNERRVGVVETITVTHPYDTDMEYSTQKIKLLRDHLNNNIPITSKTNNVGSDG